MARRRRGIERFIDSFDPAERDPFSIANDDLFTLPRRPVLPSVRSYLPEIEDRRFWRPDPVAPLRSLRNSVHRLVAAPAVKRAGRRTGPKFFKVNRVHFGNSDVLLHCIRRKRRKEVLHALRRVGRGSGGPRRWKWSSQFSC